LINNGVYESWRVVRADATNRTNRTNRIFGIRELLYRYASGLSHLSAEIVVNIAFIYKERIPYNSLCYHSSTDTNKFQNMGKPYVRVANYSYDLRNRRLLVKKTIIFSLLFVGQLCQQVFYPLLSPFRL
jgi:hypothetical protein